MSESFDAIEQVKSTAVDLALRFGPKLFTAVIIFVIGVVVARWTARVLALGLERLEIEPPLRGLLARVARIVVLVLFIVMALQNAGVELVPLLAGLGVLGAGVALAMQGLLSDLAAGLSIILSRPYRVREYISIVGEHGEVRDITLFNTVLSDPDGSTVVIPNRKIVGEIYHNYGRVRQLDLVVGVAYDSDLDLALAIIREVLQANPRVLQEPPALVQPVRFANSSIEIGVKPWVPMDQGFAARGEIHRAIARSFRERGISIPQELRVIGALHGQPSG